MTTFPLRINWPADAAVAVPEKWQRLPDGRIQATYRDQLELRWCLLVTRIMRERGVTPAVITSYSIHYTKLYELVPPWPVEAIPIGTRKRAYIASPNEGTDRRFHSERQHTAGRREER